MTIRLHEKFSPFGKLILGALLVTVLGLAVPALASAAWTVDSTGDQTDQTLGDGFCKTAASTCTLRAAIEESNAEGGTQEIFFGPTFNGQAGSTIVLGSALPAFHPALGEINGVSAGACLTSSLATGPCVEVDAPAGAKTLEVSAGGETTIKGLDLAGGAVGIEALAAGPLVAEENWIGKKLDGTAATATSTGVNVADAAAIVGNSISGSPIGVHTSGADAQGNRIRLNVISGATSAGILIENSSNQVFGNQVSNSGIGIRIHDGTAPAEENKIGGVQFGAVDPDANLITGSAGAAIEINTASTSVANKVLRNGGSGNGGPFIALVKLSPGEPKGPNEGLQPPVITTATLTGASGTAEPESFVRVYANATVGEGEMGTFLGLAEAAPITGAWSLTYAAPPATANFAASQTTAEDEGSSSALAFTKYVLKVQKAGSGAGTVTSAPAGINCGAQCEASFAKGGLVKLLGSAAAGSSAVVWAGCDAVNGAGECEVTMSAAKSVTATFDLIPSSGGGGDGGGGGSGTPTPTPTPSPVPTKPAPVKKPLKCKAGFKKKTLKGKAICVKVKKAKKHH
ncbi:MAG TPA: NosD domain-containing protein [Solirubrobacterales bacterium]|nr:NosD domain-containing protein [Solirubrobacterales bacterium]